MTSYAATPSGAHHALAYLKCKSKGVQLKLEDLVVAVQPAAGGAPVAGRVVAVPALSRDFPAAGAAEQRRGAGGGPAASSTDSDAELAARSEEARCAHWAWWTGGACATLCMRLTE